MFCYKQAALGRLLPDIGAMADIDWHSQQEE